MNKKSETKTRKDIKNLYILDDYELDTVHYKYLLIYNDSSYTFSDSITNTPNTYHDEKKFLSRWFKDYKLVKYFNSPLYKALTNESRTDTKDS